MKSQLRTVRAGGGAEFDVCSLNMHLRMRGSIEISGWHAAILRERHAVSILSDEPRGRHEPLAPTRALPRKSSSSSFANVVPRDPRRVRVETQLRPQAVSTR